MKNRPGWELIGSRRGGFLMCMAILGCILVSCGIFSPPTPKPEPALTATPPDRGAVKVLVENIELQDVNNIIVRVLDTRWVDTKADDKKLILPSCEDGQFVTAWASGYYIATQPCRNGQDTYSFTLQPYHVNDNSYYTWVEARNSGQPRSCEPCHNGSSPDMPEYLEYKEWQADGHARVLTNSYFWTTYMGMDAYGNQGQYTAWDVSNNSRHVRRNPDPSQPYYGPGFKTDFPANYGNCAFCHVPASVSAPQTEVDIVPVIQDARSGRFSAATEGINCDVCHKVLNVRLDPGGVPFPDKPGVLSFDFVREDSNAMRLYVGPMPGTYTNGMPENSLIGVTCSPVFSQSQFCAPCHFSRFWGTQIYNSYGEWLASPYAKEDNKGGYKTCQACHMTVNNGTPEGDPNVDTSQRRACSQDNTSYDDFNHNMMRRGDDNLPAIITNAAKIDLDAKKAGDQFEVQVKVTNTKAGHKFPTDSPLRHLILLVEVEDSAGNAIPQVSGPTIPAWGGVGTQPADYAGRPGEIYANILMDMDTNQAPTVAYWNQTRAAWNGSDTRLEPFTPRTSKYTFAIPANGPARILVRLIYRYAFIDIVRQKSWDRSAFYQPDIEVAAVECKIDPAQPATWECSHSSQ